VIHEYIPESASREEKDVCPDSIKETLMKALPRQGESEKAMEFQHVKPKALMLIRSSSWN